MKCISLIVICITLQCTFVYGRTVQDVLEDFQPVFDEIHGSIQSLHTLARGYSSSQQGDVRGASSEFSSQGYLVLLNVLVKINDEARKSLKTNGMIGHEEDLVKHCVVKKDESKTILTHHYNAGANVCRQLGNKAVENLFKIWSEYTNSEELSTLHTSLDSVKEKCADRTTPLEMQTCLIEHLYFLQKPHVENLRREMDDFVENNQKYVTRVVEDLTTCFFGIVTEKTLKDSLPIIADFNKCVVEVAENQPK